MWRQSNSHISGSELTAHKKSNQILLAASQAISIEINVNANGSFLQVFQKSSILAVYLILWNNGFSAAAYLSLSQENTCPNCSLP